MISISSQLIGIWFRQKKKFISLKPKKSGIPDEKIKLETKGFPQILGLVFRFYPTIFLPSKASYSKPDTLLTFILNAKKWELIINPLYGSLTSGVLGEEEELLPELVPVAVRVQRHPRGRRPLQQLRLHGGLGDALAHGDHLCGARGGRWICTPPTCRVFISSSLLSSVVAGSSYRFLLISDLCAFFSPPPSEAHLVTLTYFY